QPLYQHPNVNPDGQTVIVRVCWDLRRTANWLVLCNQTDLHGRERYVYWSLSDDIFQPRISFNCSARRLFSLSSRMPGMPNSSIYDTKYTRPNTTSRHRQLVDRCQHDFFGSG